MECTNRKLYRFINNKSALLILSLQRAALESHYYEGVFSSLTANAGRHGLGGVDLSVLHTLHFSTSGFSLIERHPSGWKEPGLKMWHLQRGGGTPALEEADWVFWWSAEREPTKYQHILAHLKYFVQMGGRPTTGPVGVVRPTSALLRSVMGQPKISASHWAVYVRTQPPSRAHLLISVLK